MDILLLGAGNIGRAIACELSTDHEVTAVDMDEEALQRISEHAKTEKFDVSDRRSTRDLMKDFDLVIGALPGIFGYRSVEDAVEAGTDIVDVSFMPQDPLDLDSRAEKNDVTVIVDAGFGPGMSNVLMGKISDEMDDLDRGMIRIGGLPKDPKPPLFYKLTWSPQDLIEEYTRKARMKREGEIVRLDPLDEINEIEIRGRKFEEFYSDGLRTLLETIEAKTLEETTLRWKGHLEKIKILRELGFFEEENLENTLDVITPHMRFESKDFSIMDIHAEGRVDGEETEINYFFYDEAGDRFSSMSRATGFTAAVMARLLNKKDLEGGVIPPEELGMEEEYFDFIVERIRDKGIKIERC